MGWNIQESHGSQLGQVEQLGAGLISLSLSPSLLSRSLFLFKWFLQQNSQTS